jgi:hypothetical protein
VLHLSESACHLADDEGWLLSLVINESDMGPHAVQLPVDLGPLRRILEPSHRAIVTPTGLRLGPLRIRTVTARLVDSRPDWAALRSHPHRLGRALPVLRAELDRRPPVDGDRLRRAARLANAPAGGDTRAALAAADRLAGLGEGLTPAGDDLLLGVLYALWATNPRPFDAAEAVAERAAAPTTTLSAAWLRAAAAGEATRPWHELVDAMATGDPLPAARRVAAIGHSTGVHSLTGFVLGLGRMAEKQEER